MNPMISVMSYELNHNRVECLYDGIETWFILARNREICEAWISKTFQGASEKMDQVIKELNPISPEEEEINVS